MLWLLQQLPLVGLVWLTFQEGIRVVGRSPCPVHGWITQGLSAP